MVLCDWYSGSAAKSHSPSTQYRQLHRLQSAVGSETVREKPGWQGKLSTRKGHKCNEARIPTNAFYLKRKALLPGKQRHDTEIMVTYDQVINLEFDCQVRMYFCRRLHNQYGEKRNSPMVYRLVFFRMTRFRYFAVGEYHPRFTCNSDVNLVNREANLYFFKLVLFRPYLASAWLKNNRKT